MLHYARFFRLLALFSLVPTLLSAQDSSGYGFVRTLEGSAAIFRADTGERIEITPNQPILTGDELIVDRESRVELILPDFTILRIGAETILRLDALAFSGDGTDHRTVLSLVRGDVQLVSGDYALGDERPVVDLGTAAVHALEPGTYRLSRTDSGEARLVVRSGSAEMSTDRQSEVALLDEEIIVTSAERPELFRYAASGHDELELWGGELSRAAAGSEGELDPALAYSGAPMATGGTWIRVETGNVWRPYAASSWRPYMNGSWFETPSGLTWVSHEPWGWVTAHYGFWSHHHHHGWVWHPGRAYSPAWVFWHWGADWVGWVPVGYYGSHHYGYSHRTYYGYAGGSWDHYRHWNFCPTRYVGRPDARRHHRRGSVMPGETGLKAIPRGVITSDTSGLSRANWGDGAEAERVLSRRASASRVSATRPSMTRPSKTEEVLGVRRRAGTEIEPNALRSMAPRPRGTYPLPDRDRVSRERSDFRSFPPVAERVVESKEPQRVPPARRVIDGVRRRSATEQPAAQRRERPAVRERAQSSSGSARATPRRDSQPPATRSRSPRRSASGETRKSGSSRSTQRKSSSSSGSRSRRSKSDG